MQKKPCEKFLEVTSESQVRRIFYFYEFYSRRNTHIREVRSKVSIMLSLND